MEVQTGVLRTALRAGTPIGARLNNNAASGNYTVTACHKLALCHIQSQENTMNM